MIRVGLVGFGLGGRVFHAPLLSSVDGLELTAVVERSTDQAAQRYPGIRVHRTLEAMLNDTALDLIVISTPSGTHFEMARRVVEAGFHAVVDKPMCAHSAQIAELAAMAAERNRLLIPFHNRLWDGDFLTVRQILNEGALGRPIAFHSIFDRWVPGTARAAWKDAPNEGSGNLLDLGTHLASQALQLFGPPLAVWAEVGRERAGEGSNDAFLLRLQYPELAVTLESNYLCALPRSRFLLRGTAGSYQKNGVDPQEAALGKIARIDEADWGREPESGWGTLAVEEASGLARKRTVPTLAGDYRRFYQGVREAVTGHAAPPVTVLDAWRVARLLEWAEQSSRERREIPCDWPEPAPTRH
jgi:predicted dehydrogenase